MAKSVVPKTYIRPTPTGPYTWGNLPVPVWSDPNAWPSGAVPARGADVTIAAGQQILMDGVYVQGRVHVNGDLRGNNDFPNFKLKLKDGHCHGNGRLLIDDGAGGKFTGRAVFEFYGDMPATPPQSQGHERGWMFMDDSKIKINAVAPTPSMRLNAHAAAGTNTFTLHGVPEYWKAGDEIVIGPTDFYLNPGGVCQLMTLAADVTTTTMTTVETLGAARWGRLQYAHDTAGWSLTETTFTKFPAGVDPGDFPIVLDERAIVVNLTRGVTFQGADDASWQLDGFGMHMMVMGLGVEVNIDGAGWDRCGQQGHIARYPFHWHMPSYSSTFLGSAHETSLATAITLSPPVGTTMVILRAGAQALRYTTDGSTPTAGTGTPIEARKFARQITTGLNQIKIIQQASGGEVFIEYRGGDGSFLGAIPPGWGVLKNCAITNSRQRGVVVHGACGAEIEDTIGYNVQGHIFFEEDGAELGTKWTRCIGLQSLPVPDGNLSSGYPIRLMDHERDDNMAGASIFWVTNPDTDLIDCYAARANGKGIWWATPQAPMGLSALVSMYPLNVQLGTVRGNTSCCNKIAGARFHGSPTDSIKNSVAETSIKYFPRDDETPSGNPVRLTIERMMLFKNPTAYDNNTSFPDYKFWLGADNAGSVFQGITQPTNTPADRGKIFGSMLSGPSLNASTWPSSFGTDDRSGYQWGPSGMATYHGTLIMDNCVGMGLSVIDGVLSGLMRENDYYTDPLMKFHQYMNNIVLIDSDFAFRALPPHLSGYADAPATNHDWTFADAVWDQQGYRSGGLYPEHYHIFDYTFSTYGDADLKDAAPGNNGKLTPKHFYGVQAKNNRHPEGSSFNHTEHVKFTRYDSGGSVVGTKEIQDGTGDLYGGFRHFAAANGGIYLTEYPTNGAPSSYSEIQITNCYRAGDSFLGGWSLSAAPAGVTSWIHATNSAGPTFTAAANRAEVEAGSGNKYWYDAANQIIWIKVAGSINTAPVTNPYADPLMRPISLFISEAA